MNLHWLPGRVRGELSEAPNYGVYAVLHRMEGDVEWQFRAYVFFSMLDVSTSVTTSCVRLLVSFVKLPWSFYRLHILAFNISLCAIIAAKWSRYREVGNRRRCAGFHCMFPGSFYVIKAQNEAQRFT